MKILIPHSWLSEYLVTNASPAKIAECLSLCGPTVDRIEKRGGDWVYDIEITTNRVDAMSVYGIAREAAAILPQFDIKASLKPLKLKGVDNNTELGIEIINNPKLCHRILAVKLENVNLAPSPKWLQERLTNAGQRPLINAIDITNYLMWEIGHPTHAFDYDRVGDRIVVREANKGEVLTTLDNKTLELSGGEVVFVNAKGVIIDLPGIMGTKNTVVTKDTKNVLLWIESVDPIKIRKASMGLGIRSQAATLNEKGVDTELGLDTILRGVELFQQITGAKVGSKLIDFYPKHYKPSSVKTNLEFINTRIGVNLTKPQISTILKSLDFNPKWNKNNLTVEVPSFRSNDISIPEDIVEEVARIHGYYNLPSQLMTGMIPDKPQGTPFEFESIIKNTLMNLDGNEIYSPTFISNVGKNNSAIKILNPLGSDGEYLRASLDSSLLEAARSNTAEPSPYHIFEMANVYLNNKNDLPEEIMTLSGIFVNTKYRDAKGVIEALLEKLGIIADYVPEDDAGYNAGRRVVIKSKSKLGSFGVLESGEILYTLDVNSLRLKHSAIKTYDPLPKFPPQIEDITLTIPKKTKIVSILDLLMSSDKISKAELSDTYNASHTFRVWFQSKNKTLTDSEVKDAREKVLSKLENEFGAIQK